MILNSGYKQSEMGVIPDTWDVVEMSALLEFRNGVNADKKAYGSGIRFINVLEVITKSHLSGADIPGRVTLPQSVIESYAVRRGDLVFNRTSETQDEVGLTSVYMDDTPVVYGGFVIRGRPTTDRLFPQFSGYAFRSHAVRSQIIACGQGAIRANIGQSDLRKIRVALPNLEEQQAIASALSEMDALIIALDQLIAKKRKIKQGMVQELLTGKKRLPGFNKDWKLTKLGDCLLKRPDYGVNAAAVKFSDKLPTYIRITDISDDGIFISENRASVDHINSNQYFLEKDDLVFARTGASTGKTYLYNPLDGNLVFAGFLIRVKVDPQKLIARYLKIYTETAGYWKWVRVMSMRSGQPGINGMEFSQLDMLLPPLKEQEAISQIFIDMDAEIESLMHELAKYKMIKQGMMQELLTGRTRLI